jgi:uncharacterized membrane protein YhaH (DUF805 family)
VSTPAVNRLTRSGDHFWNVILIYLALGLIPILMIHAASDEQDISKITATVLIGVLGAAMAASLLAVSVSRLHDRGLSGWWIFVYYGFPAAAIVRLSLVHPADWEFAVLVGVIMGCVPWAIFALGFMPGTIGPNRFGEESPWFRDTRRRRKHTAPPPVSQNSTTAQPAAGAPSAVVTPPPLPTNPTPAPAIQAPASATQAPATAMQAPAATVSSTAEAQSVHMSSPAASANNRDRIREIVGDLISVNGRMDSSRYGSARRSSAPMPSWRGW